MRIRALFGAGLGLALVGVQPVLAVDSGSPPCLSHGEGEAGFLTAMRSAQLVVAATPIEVHGRIATLSVQAVYRGDPGGYLITVGPETADVLYGDSCRSAAGEFKVGEERLLMAVRAPRTDPPLPYMLALADSSFGYAPLLPPVLGWLEAGGYPAHPYRAGQNRPEPPLLERVGVLVAIAVLVVAFAAGTVLLMFAVTPAGRVARRGGSGDPPAATTDD